MAVGPGGIPLSLLAVVLLFIPGIVGTDLFYRVSKQRNPLSRSQVLVYSAGMSLLSILLLYLLSSIYFVPVSTFATDTALFLDLATQQQIANTTLPAVVALYVAHFAVATIIGLLTGCILKRIRDSESDPRDPWSYAFDQLREKEKIEVLLTDGTVIHGQINLSSIDKNSKDLFLEDPTEVRYGINNADVFSKNDLGRSILLAENFIFRVLFLEEDPQTRVSDRYIDRGRDEAARSVRELFDRADEAEGDQEDGDEAEGDQEENDDSCRLRSKLASLRR